MKNVTEKLPIITVVTGILLFVIAAIIPYDSMEFALGEGLRPIGLVLLFINPILGVLGSFFSVIKRKWIFLPLNIILIFSFFVVIMIFGFV